MSVDTPAEVPLASSIEAPPHLPPPPAVRFRTALAARFRRWVWPMTAVLAVALIYLPSLSHGLFVVDDPHLFRSPRFTTATAENWLALVSTPQSVDYRPVGDATFLLEATIFPADPTDAPSLGRRLMISRTVNFALHALNAVLVWALFSGWLHGPRFSPTETPRPRPRPATATATAIAGVAALIFALHPLAVEPVVWLTGRYTVLSLTFTLAAALAYWRWRTRPADNGNDGSRRGDGNGNGWLVVSTGCVVLGVLVKAWAVTAVALIVLCEWVVVPRRGRWSRGAWRVAPAFGVTAVFVGISAVIVAQSQPVTAWGAGLRDHLPLLPRYLLHFCAPISLSFFYAVPPWSWLGTIGITTATAGALAGVWWMAGANRIATVALGWMVAPLMLVLGFLPVQWGHFHDRYFYFSLPAAALIAALVGTTIIERTAWPCIAKIARDEKRQRQWRTAGHVALVIALTALGGLAMQQASMWRSTETVLQTALRRSPDSALVHHHIGVLLASNAERLAQHHQQQPPSVSPSEPASLWAAQQRADATRAFFHAFAAPDFEVVLSPGQRMTVFRETITALAADGDGESLRAALQVLPMAEALASEHPALLGQLAKAYLALDMANEAAETYRRLFAALDESRRLAKAVVERTHGRPWRVPNSRWYVTNSGRDPAVRANEWRAWQPLAQDFPLLALERNWPEARDAALWAAAMYPTHPAVLRAVESVLRETADAETAADLADHIAAGHVVAPPFPSTFASDSADE